MTTLPSTDLAHYFGFDQMSDGEQLHYTAELMQAVLDRTILRLVASLSDQQVEALDHFLESEPTPEVVLQHLAETYTAFPNLFSEEVAALKEEMNHFATIANE